MGKFDKDQRSGVYSDFFGMIQSMPEIVFQLPNNESVNDPNHSVGAQKTLGSLPLGGMNPVKGRARKFGYDPSRLLTQFAINGFRHKNRLTDIDRVEKTAANFPLSPFKNDLGCPLERYGFSEEKELSNV